MKLVKWLKRIGSGLLLLLVLLLVVGFIYERIARANAGSTYAPDGAFVDVGGYKLHYLQQGQGGPTVVFESGLDGGGHVPWQRVQNAIAENTTTVSYDRSGILWSERGDKPRTGAAMARDLAALLNTAGLEKPYILVGHSLAGLTLKSFVDLYPQDVAGVVFVDASHSDQMKRIPEELLAEMQPPPGWLIKLMNNFGVLRLLMSGEAYPGTEDAAPINQLLRSVTHLGLSATIEEMAALDNLAEEASKITSFGDVPLTVITGTSEDRFEMLPDQAMYQIWLDLQTDLLQLSSDSRQVLAAKSGHYVHLEEPEIVIEAIREMLTALKAPVTQE